MPVAKYPFVPGANPTVNSRISHRERNPGLCSGCRNSPSGSHQAETHTTVRHHTFHQPHNTEGTNLEKSQGCPGLQKERVSGLPSLTNYVMHTSLLIYSCPLCYPNLIQNTLLEKSCSVSPFTKHRTSRYSMWVSSCKQAGIKSPKHLLQISHPLLLLHFCLLSPHYGLRTALGRSDRNRTL